MCREMQVTTLHPEIMSKEIQEGIVVQFKLSLACMLALHDDTAICAA